MLHLFAPFVLALAPAHDLTGVYEVTGAPGDIRLVLHERANGEIIGYIAGSPMVWIESGQRYGDSVLLEVMGADGGSEESWSATVRLRVLGRTLEGVLIQGKDVIPLTLLSSLVSFVEEPWLWYDESLDVIHEVRRTLDISGNFLGGGFSASDSCSFMACGGNIDSWTETSGNHDIWTSSSGDCGQTGHLVGAFDSAANQLNGTWDSTDCNSNTYNGTFLAGKGGSTFDKHIRGVLLSIGAFADDFEAESLDAADVFHSSYLSDGVTRSDWEAQLAAWYAAYDEIEVEIMGLTEVVTIIDSDVHPYLLGNPRISWRVSASGIDVVSGAEETFWERMEPEILGPGLRFVDVENGRVVFTGNGETQPLSIGLPVQLADVYYDGYVAWPFGVHGGGHANDGHPGIDFSFIAGSDVYAVEAGTITSIIPNTGWPLPQWDVTQEIRTGVFVQYGHIADPPQVSRGDVLVAGDVIGSPSNFGGADEILHFSLSMGAGGNTCPIPWFNVQAQADWDVIWTYSSYNEELCEPFSCNAQDASPPYTATWDLETAGATPGPDSIYFFRVDGYEHNYVYTFFDSTGTPTETGVTEGMGSPSTLGLKFIADGTGVITFGAADVISDEFTLKLDTTMPTDMIGAATYRYQE